MADILGAAVLELSTDSSKLDAGLAGAEQKVGSLNSKLATAGKAAATAFVAAGAAAAGLGGVSLKAAIDFESSFAGVIKTVDATDEELQGLADSFRQMAKEIPLNVNEINAIGEAAGQLGIKTENIEAFTRTMADLGVATNMTSEQAATSLARLANITQMPQTEFDRLGSTVVALGNNLATTEGEIVEMGLRLAGAGSQAGLTEAEILGLAGSLTSVGIQAEAGGTAFSQVMIEMGNAVMDGGANLEAFASAAGMTADQFAATWQDQPAEAIISFVEGLADIDKEGGNVNAILDELGLGGLRVSDALRRSAGAGDLMRESLKIGTAAWEENNALTKEAEERYKTTASQIQLLRNQFNDVAITIGQFLLPAFNRVLSVISDALPRAIGIAAVAFEWLRDILSAQMFEDSFLGGLTLAIARFVGAAEGDLGGTVSNIIATFRRLADIVLEVIAEVGPGLMTILGFFGRVVMAIAPDVWQAFTGVLRELLNAVIIPLWQYLAPLIAQFVAFADSARAGNPAFESLTENLRNIAYAAETVARFLIEMAAGVGTQFWSDLLTVGGLLLDNVLRPMGSVLMDIVGYFAQFSKSADDTSAAMGRISEGSKAFEVLVGVLTKALEAWLAWKAASMAYSAIAGAAKAIKSEYDKVVSTLKAAKKGVEEFYKAGAKTVSFTVKAVTTGADAVSTLARNIAGITSKTVSVTANVAGAGFDKLTDALGTLTDKTVKVTVSGADTAKVKVDDLVTSLKNLDADFSPNIKLPDASMMGMSFGGSLVTGMVQGLGVSMGIALAPAILTGLTAALGIAAAGIGAVVAAPVVLIAAAIIGALVLAFMYPEVAGQIVGGIAGAIFTATVLLPAALIGTQALLAVMLAEMLLEALKAAAEIAGAGIEAAFETWKEIFVNLPRNLVGSLIEQFGVVFGEIGDVISELIKGNWGNAARESLDVLKEIFIGFPESLMEPFKEAFGNVGDIFEEFGEKAKESLGDTFDNIKDIAEERIGQIVDIFAGIGEKLLDPLTKGLEKLDLSWGDVWDKIKDAASKGLDTVIDVAGEKAGEFVEGFKEGFTGVVDAATDTLGDLRDEITGKLSGIVGDIKGGAGDFLSAGGELIGGLYDGATEKFGEVTSWAGGIAGDIIDAIGDLLGTLASKGNDLIQGLWDGAIETVGSFLTYIISIPGMAVSAIGDTLGTLYQKGWDLIQGFVNGVKNAWDSLKGGVSDVLSGIPFVDIPGYSPLHEAIPHMGRNFGEGFIEGLIDGMTNMIPSLRAEVKGTGETFADEMARADWLGDVKSVFGEAGADTFDAFLNALVDRSAGSESAFFDSLTGWLDEAGLLGTEMGDAIMAAALEALSGHESDIADFIATLPAQVAPDLGRQFAEVIVDAQFHDSLVERFGEAGAAALEKLNAVLHEGGPDMVTTVAEMGVAAAQEAGIWGTQAGTEWLARLNAALKAGDLVEIGILFADLLPEPPSTADQWADLFHLEMLHDQLVTLFGEAGADAAMALYDAIAAGDVGDAFSTAMEILEDAGIDAGSETGRAFLDGLLALLESGAPIDIKDIMSLLVDTTGIQEVGMSAAEAIVAGYEAAMQDEDRLERMGSAGKAVFDAIAAAGDEFSAEEATRIGDLLAQWEQDLAKKLGPETAKKTLKPFWDAFNAAMAEGRMLTQEEWDLLFSNMGTTAQNQIDQLGIIIGSLGDVFVETLESMSDDGTITWDNIWDNLAEIAETGVMYIDGEMVTLSDAMRERLEELLALYEQGLIDFQTFAEGLDTIGREAVDQASGGSAVGGGGPPKMGTAGGGPVTGGAPPTRPDGTGTVTTSDGDVYVRHKTDAELKKLAEDSLYGTTSIIRGAANRQIAALNPADRRAYDLIRRGMTQSVPIYVQDPLSGVWGPGPGNPTYGASPSVALAGPHWAVDTRAPAYQPVDTSQYDGMTGIERAWAGAGFDIIPADTEGSIARSLAFMQGEGGARARARAAASMPMPSVPTGGGGNAGLTVNGNMVFELPSSAAEGPQEFATAVLDVINNVWKQQEFGPDALAHGVGGA